MPKKNGKTELAAALALYFLIGDGEPAPLVVCAAASDDQADLVFGACKIMAEHSPTLSLICETFDREILVPSIPGAKLKRVAAASGTNDGQNIHAVILDELHEWTGTKGEAVWNVLTNAAGAREQPIVLQITTAGFDRKTICYRQYEYGKAVATGEKVDRRFLFHWIEAEAEADYTDPATWEAANPSYGVTVGAEFFEDQVTKKLPNVFIRYFLNRWTSSQTRWLSIEAWDACDGAPDIPEGSSVVLGIDGGAKRDTTSVAMVRWDPATRTVHVISKVWEPPGDGEPIDPSGPENYVRDLCKRYHVLEADFDPQLFFRSAQLLAEEGLPMVEFPQTHARMCPASQALYDIVQEGRLRHGGDAILRAHADAAVARETGRGWRLDKEKASDHIDAMVALAMAAFRAQELGANAPGLMVI